MNHDDLPSSEQEQVPSGTQVPPPAEPPPSAQVPPPTEPPAAGQVPPPAEPPAEPPAPGILELMYGALFAPVSTFRNVAARPQLGKCTIVLLIVVIIGAVGGMLSFHRQMGAFSGFGSLSEFTGPGVPGMPEFPVQSFAAARMPMIFVAVPIGSFLLWYLQTAVFHLTAVLLGGQGQVVPLMAVLALGTMPGVFSGPAMLLGALVHSSVGDWLNFILGIWSLVLYAIGIREVHRFSTGRAVATLLMPLVVVIALVLLMVLIMFVGFASMFGHMFPGGTFTP